MSIKYIFITGGVVSGLGKGITAASLGRLLKERGYKVTVQKFDPYINVDPGIMSPYQHGEVFVTEDGAETDLDIGHYERFIDENLSVNSNITSGKIYWTVINKERSGEYDGGTVQVIPHITNEIKDRVYRVGKDSDIVITEIGGTVGDIESQPFMEAIRQVVTEVGRDNAMYIHVTLVPTVPGSTELKSKPTQHSVKALLSMGINPNVLVCRADYQIPDDMRDKIALFCSIRKEDIVQNITVESLYEAPLMLEEEGLAKSVCYHLDLKNSKTPPMHEWKQMIGAIKSATKKTSIALVGKYTELPDAYLSVIEALEHGGIPNDAKVDIKLINSEGVTVENVDRILLPHAAIIVPTGFGKRGLEGKMLAIKFARENKVPFLGLGLGLHLVATEMARHLLGQTDADSVEFNPDTTHPISVLIDKINEADMTSTMRLGAFECDIEKDSLLEKIYKAPKLSERHRHRYQVNKDVIPELERVGLSFTSFSSEGGIIEAVEIKDHPWFLAVQFNPEFKSRPNRPHPIFTKFIEAALKNK